MLALILPGNAARDRSLAAPVHPIPVGQATSRTKGSWRQCTLCLGNRRICSTGRCIGRPTKLLRLARRCPRSPYGFSLADENSEGRRGDGHVREKNPKINLFWM